MIVCEIEHQEAHFSECMDEAWYRIEYHDFLVGIDIGTICRRFEISEIEITLCEKVTYIFPYPLRASSFFCISSDVTREHDVSHGDKVYLFYFS